MQLDAVKTTSIFRCFYYFMPLVLQIPLYYQTSRVPTIKSSQELLRASSANEVCYIGITQKLILWSYARYWQYGNSDGVALCALLNMATLHREKPDTQ